MKREPALDGVRAFAALAVILMHCGAPWAARGGIGVDVFFVLSGYLITRLLADEIAETGGADYRAFCTRRLRRLAPALFLMLAVTAAISPFLLPAFAPEIVQHALVAGAYLTNLAVALGEPIQPFSHTWTLGVEMQFYLVWPLLLPAILRKRRPWLWLLAGWVASMAGWQWALAHSLTRFSVFQGGALFLGAIIALRPALPAWTAWAGAIGLILAGWPVHGMRPPQDFITPIAATLLIGGLRSPSVLRSVLSWRPLVFLGTLSYGIYLWHLPITIYFWSAPWVLAAPVIFVTAASLAALSYYSVEAPFRGGRPQPLADSPGIQARVVHEQTAGVDLGGD